MFKTKQDLVRCLYVEGIVLDIPPKEIITFANKLGLPSRTLDPSYIEEDSVVVLNFKLFAGLGYNLLESKYFNDRFLCVHIIPKSYIRLRRPILKYNKLCEYLDYKEVLGIQLLDFILEQ